MTLQKKKSNKELAALINQRSGHHFIPKSQYDGRLRVEIPQEFPVFIRAGSLKTKGYQITIRENLLGAVQSNGGYILFPRGVGYLIPLEFIREFVGGVDSQAFDRQTVDIFIDENDSGKGVVRYHDAEKSIKKFALS